MKFYIGLLSGTSMDVIDAAVVQFIGGKPKLHSTLQYPIPSDFKDECKYIMQTGKGALDRAGHLDVVAGNLFADAVDCLLMQSNLSTKDIIAIGSHGQTLRHVPDVEHPFTWQIGDPNIIAYRSGITTVADFRRADMAAGGNGAPLAAIVHQQFMSEANKERWVVNIGGICNATYLPRYKDSVTLGYDLGPGNCLLDAWVHKYFQVDFDSDGQLARQGTVDQNLLNLCLADPYFARLGPKSTGREYFNLAWVDNNLSKLDYQVNAYDVLSTLLFLTVEVIARTIVKGEVILCGGGALNAYMIEQLTSRLANLEIKTTTEFDIHPMWLEAVLFAWLAKNTLEGRSGNLPSVTGASKALVLGGIYGFNPAKCLVQQHTCVS